MDTRIVYPASALQNPKRIVFRSIQESFEHHAILTVGAFVSGIPRTKSALQGTESAVASVVVQFDFHND
jgi:hypothetical protein